MRDLVRKLQSTSSQSRINAIEDSYRGSKFAQSNHKVEWMGYDQKGQALVKSSGKVYSGTNLSRTSLKPRERVLMRTGKGVKTITN